MYVFIILHRRTNLIHLNFVKKLNYLILIYANNNKIPMMMPELLHGYFKVKCLLLLPCCGVTGDIIVSSSTLRIFS